ncbi:MAG: hypothetical protein AAGF87_01985 [Bacteroidota bacterium]
MKRNLIRFSALATIFSLMAILTSCSPVQFDIHSDFEEPLPDSSRILIVRDEGVTELEVALVRELRKAGHQIIGDNIRYQDLSNQNVQVVMSDSTLAGQGSGVIRERFFEQGDYDYLLRYRTRTTAETQMWATAEAISHLWIKVIDVKTGTIVGTFQRNGRLRVVDLDKAAKDFVYGTKGAQFIYGR